MQSADVRLALLEEKVKNLEARSERNRSDWIALGVAGVSSLIHLITVLMHTLK